jgi:hypothetical protein
MGFPLHWLLISPGVISIGPFFNACLDMVGNFSLFLHIETLHISQTSHFVSSPFQQLYIFADFLIFQWKWLQLNHLKFMYFPPFYENCIFCPFHSKSCNWATNLLFFRMKDVQGSRTLDERLFLYKAIGKFFCVCSGGFRFRSQPTDLLYWLRFSWLCPSRNML